MRRATASDRSTLAALWDEFSAAGPPPPWVEDAPAKAREEIDSSLSQGTAVIAEADGSPVGFAYGVFRTSRAAELTDLYVRPAARRRGLATALVREFVTAVSERGGDVVTVTTAADNDAARRLYERAGFRADSINLIAAVATLRERLQHSPGTTSFGSIHVQSDDLSAVERAVREFVPRLPGRSSGSVVSPPRNGWIAIYDELCDREPEMRRRLARELSARMGAVVLTLGVEDGAVAGYLLFERGQVVDEYVSVPEYRGPLPPGDVVALAANARVLARLTGADPNRVREAARTARSTGDLPPADDLLAALARAIGVEGGEHGFEAAAAIPGAVKIAR